MCDEPYGHYRADDAPAWLTILIVGHITAPVMVALAYLQMEVWIEQVIFVPAIVLLTLILLPICKGVILALLWTTKAEGSEKI